ncbi:MAG: DUF2313 domain-containing protein [Ruminococcus sp.]|nr:DUF2313 domain-containing protein [Ruminococcus sp.]MBQ7133977.1 DUF2313 domain-containing protein [Ruminococcus sp.]
MKDTYTSMTDALSAFNLYSFDNTNISTELSVYAYFLDELNAELTTMLNECFIDTASYYGLSYRELIIGAERMDLSVVQRREMLKLRESICKSSFTLEKIKESIRSFGLDFEIYEYPSLYIVRIDAVGDYSKAERLWITSEIEKIMPAHLSVRLVFGGPTWEECDSKNNTFSAIDALNYTWQEIDNLD